MLSGTLPPVSPPGEPSAQALRFLRKDAQKLQSPFSLYT
jgi:hypothetical protein